MPDELTKEQVEEILKYCDDWPKMPFENIAEQFSQKYERRISGDMIYTIFMQKECRRHDV